MDLSEEHGRLIKSAAVLAKAGAYKASDRARDRATALEPFIVLQRIMDDQLAVLIEIRDALVPQVEPGTTEPFTCACTRHGGAPIANCPGCGGAGYAR